MFIFLFCFDPFFYIIYIFLKSIKLAESLIVIDKSSYKAAISFKGRINVFKIYSEYILEDLFCDIIPASWKSKLFQMCILNRFRIFYGIKYLLIH